MADMQPGSPLRTHPVPRKNSGKRHPLNGYPHKRRRRRRYAPTHDAIRKALERVLRPYDVWKAYVYGSYARGDQTPESDIDLRFLCGDNITYGGLYRISNKLEKTLSTEVDILACKPEKLRPSFYDSIKDDEVLLYTVSRS